MKEYRCAMAGSTSRSELLGATARALADDPRVMASVLTAYQRRRGWDEAAMAAWLGMAPERLPHLALCRRPDPASPTVAADVARLAAYVGCAPESLRHVLELVAGSR